MSQPLPLDTSHPVVREYLALVRLQVLTPVSTLINLATILVTAVIIRPRLGEISHMYPTAISPSPWMFAVYWAVTFLGLIGFCLLLVIARKAETKNALVYAAGLPVPLAHWLMAAWAVSFSFQAFTVSLVFVSALVALLLFVNIRLIARHPPTTGFPLDYLFLHAPLRLFLLLPLCVTLPHNIFLVIGHSWVPGHPNDYDRYQWEGFAVIMGVGFLALLLILTRKDFVWGAGTVWALWCIGSERPKSTPVSAAIVAFTIILPVAYVITLLFLRRRKQREGQIALPPDDDGEAAGRRDDPEESWGR